MNKDQRASGRQVKGFGEIAEKPLSRKMAKSDARKLECCTRRRKWDCVRTTAEWRPGCLRTYPGVTGPDPFKARSQSYFSEKLDFHHGNKNGKFSFLDSDLYLPLKLKNPWKPFQGSLPHLRARCCTKDNIWIAKS